MPLPASPVRHPAINPDRVGQQILAVGGLVRGRLPAPVLSSPPVCTDRGRRDTLPARASSRSQLGGCSPWHPPGAAALASAGLCWHLVSRHAPARQTSGGRKGDRTDEKPTETSARSRRKPGTHPGRHAADEEDDSTIAGLDRGVNDPSVPSRPELSPADPGRASLRDLHGHRAWASGSASSPTAPAA